MLRTSLSPSWMKSETQQNYKIDELNRQCLGVYSTSKRVIKLEAYSTNIFINLVAM